MAESLLVEILTEELPPKSLATLSQSFADEVFSGLVRHQLQLRDIPGRRVFATPRRLATLIPKVLVVANDRSSEIQGPPVKAPPEAVAGFAKKQGVAVTALEKVRTGKGEFYLARVTLKGVTLESVLAEIVSEALKKLPTPKMMRWGDGDAQFVRPVHGLVMLHGKRIVPGKVLGIDAGNRTQGHRFLGKSTIALRAAEEYEARLAKDGRVIADFAVRRSEIERQLKAHAAREKGNLGDYAGLLDEVTALVEHPSVYVGAFDQSFLAVPQECLILTMRQNQKYFPLFDGAENLLPRFLIVSNMKVADPGHIVSGNERVIRPRFEDARFFYNQDRKVRLEARVPALGNVIYHRKLGTQLERTQRIQLLAGKIARALNADPILAERAAWLAKADLVTGMVGEFPELQGIMGEHYARHDGEPKPVCRALGDQYRLRLSELADPHDLTSVSLYLADRIDALVGLFGIGEAPTGEKDPFALRRAAQGVIGAFELIGAASALVRKPAPDVRDFLEYASTLFASKELFPDVAGRVHDFILERCWNALAALYPKDAVEAVISQRPKLVEINARVQAVQAFRNLPQAEILAAADKRIRNILRKSEKTEGGLDEKLLTQPEERSLLASVGRVEPRVRAFIEAGQFAEALQATVAIEPDVTAFFNKVMVNAEDPAVRATRHALLRHKLGPLMNQVADISKLAIER
jgi:glycyl-tRNA synthetase beta chain